MPKASGSRSSGTLAKNYMREAVHLDFNDADMAQAISEAMPPEGVRVFGPSDIIHGSESGQIFSQIVIEFVPQFSATVLAGWILLALEKRGKKRAKTNRKEVALKKADIVRLIQEQIASQKAREADWKKNHKKNG